MDSNLPSIRQRVAEATGPDRELDCLIEQAINPTKRVLFDPGQIRPHADPKWGELKDFPLEGWTDWEDVAASIGADRYTMSLDAVLDLVERVDEHPRAAAVRLKEALSDHVFHTRGDQFGVKVSNWLPRAVLFYLLSALIAQEQTDRLEVGR